MLGEPMLNVLLTNDDGIEADGLQAMRRALVGLDGVRLAVIAPDGNRSAMARSITTRRPLWVEEVPFADGTSRLRDRRHAGRLRAPGEPRADRGLRRRSSSSSGINHGANLGDDITYSGTVAAALEGVVLGLPAIAVSQQSRRRARSTTASTAASASRSRPRSSRALVERIEDVPLPRGTLLNVNVPAGEPERRRGRRASASASTATS